MEGAVAVAGAGAIAEDFRIAGAVEMLSMDMSGAALAVIRLRAAEAAEVLKIFACIAA